MNDDLERIRKKVQRGFEVVEVVKIKPDMIVKIEYEGIIGWGVARRQLEDEWSDERGVIVAGAKAIDDITKSLVLKGWWFDMVEESHKLLEEVTSRLTTVKMPDVTKVQTPAVAIYDEEERVIGRAN